MSDNFGMPMVDCRPAHEVITDMREQLTEREKQIVLLRTALDNANQIITFEGVPYHLLGIEDRDEALDATQDLAGGIICDASKSYLMEEVTEDGKVTFPVYKAKEPK